MIAKNLPQINDTLFFVNRVIIVLKIFETFQLAQVRYLDSPVRFMVDFNMLSQCPDESNSISIKVLGGVER